MNPIRRIISRLKLNKPEREPLLTPEQSAELEAALHPPVLSPQSKGRIIKQTHAAEFNPSPNRRGGRIVKVMPRQLQKMKQAQEKFEKDESEQPGIMDLED